jgi:hypothetical protein
MSASINTDFMNENLAELLMVLKNAIGYDGGLNSFLLRHYIDVNRGGVLISALRNLCGLGVLRLILSARIYRRAAENAEIAQRSFKLGHL